MSGGVKKLAQVVVGAVVGFAQGGPWGAVAGAALAFYAAEQQEKLNTKSPLRDNEPSAQTVRSSKAPVRFILGRVATGGVLVWAQEQAGGQTEGEWLHLVYVLSEGAVDAVENIYLGEEEIGSFGEFASYELIVNPTQVNAFLKANCPDWKDSQIGRGLSFVRVSLKYSAEKFPPASPTPVSWSAAATISTTRAPATPVTAPIPRCTCCGTCALAVACLTMRSCSRLSPVRPTSATRPSPMPTARSASATGRPASSAPTSSAPACCRNWRRRARAN